MKRMILMALIVLIPALAMGAPLDRFEMSLRAAGIPIKGVSMAQRTGEVTIHFEESATKEQRELAAERLAAFDFRPKSRPTAAQIEANLNARTAAGRTAALVKLVSKLAADRPDLLLEIGVEAD